MTNRLMNFLHTRYGFDAYSLFLLIVFFILSSVARFFAFLPILLLSYLVLLYTVVRFFSRNRKKRQAENARFLSIFQCVARWFRLQHTIHSDKEHRYFKCPNCGQPLRVPRGKGKIQIFCRSCGVHFEKKS